jgi:hypothetical protein
MDPVSGILTGVGAVASAGLGIFGAVKGSGGSTKAPEIAPPPPPANYYTYDEDGNPAGSQVWDAGQNAYIYRPAPLTPEQQAIKAKKTALKTEMLSNLSQTPADRVKAYAEYADAISKGLHQDADYQFGKMTTAQNEGMAARGLFGSRAYVDAQAELDRNKTLSDTDIANKAELGKENLANQDRQFWLSTLGSLDQDSNAQAVIAQGNMRNLQGGAQAATADLLGAYNDYNVPRMQQWQMNMAANNDMSKNMIDTASGLAFLYGYNNRTGGGSGGSGGGVSVPSSPDLSPNLNNTYRNYNFLGD